MIIGQLSLVDLIGGIAGDRTMSTLSNCLRMLRDNQMSGASGLIPHSASKLTQLFKVKIFSFIVKNSIIFKNSLYQGFLNGDGRVRMVVDSSPKEIVLFAEKAKRVEIARVVQPKNPRAAPIGSPVLVPGRRKANRVLNDALGILEKVTYKISRLY